MTMCVRLLVALVAGLLLLASAPVSESFNSQKAQVAFSTSEQIAEDINSVPCKGNSERLGAVKSLFEKMGARAEDVEIEKYGHVENVIVRKEGSSPEVIVIGAHYDKVAYGCGAVDNWSGIVAMAHLYKTVKDVPLKKTLVFVGFGREEEGLIGSKAMVKAIAKEQVGNYCAMINLDSLGLGIPQAATNLSSSKLIEQATDLAKRMQMPFEKGLINGDTDSSSFINRKIPAIAIHALAPGYKNILHSHTDKASKVNSVSVYMGYRFALALAGELDNSACDAFK
ncbi:MAG: M28 family metallopeptidase [Acidobacteriota bacterium]|nr:M28 family metallopeptidase [Acidobacteriota bacterium]